MVLGVLQGKARKDFIFIDLPELSSPSQLEKNQKNNGGEGKVWPHELSALISLLVSGTFSCSGQTNCEITFSPYSLICLLYSQGEGGANTCLPGVLLQRKQAPDLHTSSKGLVGSGFFWDSSSQCALWQEAEHLQSPSKLCRNQLLTWAALEMVRGFSCMGEHKRGRESCRDEQHLSDICPGFHHHNQASSTTTEVRWGMHWPPPLAHHHSSFSYSWASWHEEDHKGLG